MESSLFLLIIASGLRLESCAASAEIREQLNMIGFGPDLRMSG
jgi:hypothetical protein